jgi:hypothetical protein
VGCLCAHRVETAQIFSVSEQESLFVCSDSKFSLAIYSPSHRKNKQVEVMVKDIHFKATFICGDVTGHRTRPVRSSQLGHQLYLFGETLSLRLFVRAPIIEKHTSIMALVFVPNPFGVFHEVRRSVGTLLNINCPAGRRSSGRITARSCFTGVCREVS